MVHCGIKYGKREVKAEESNASTDERVAAIINISYLRSPVLKAMKKGHNETDCCSRRALLGSEEDL